ncbi:TetR/AcrR family transcriptional regulator [Bradyrhizobium sp. G127]|uniref:TetR/AcrR family transcriptional regulator n=1 Tax=Bradyrhizobium sp. G127 TaxID=2904800 RepID=UPI001F3B967E|nr:TetR/AcrR family transcriptional regulator [Bradyrhizobium sp. G127]MCF2523304.1 TetR/AcrR family transcriptional regulator [Bradyrhizobium sp. G127]
MPRDARPTRTRIIEAAAKLYYGEGIRSVSVDAVAEKARVTKRTLYYHFKSKDDLIAAYLDARDQPNLKTFARWFQDTKGSLPAKIEGIFTNLAKSARHPKWKGCGFLRTAAELAGLPGHPAMKIGARHKSNVESWLAGVMSDGGIGNAGDLARQIVILLDGAFSTTLIHRDPAYIEAAGRAAAGLVKARIGKRR